MIKTAQMQGGRRVDSEAYDCTPQEDTRSPTPQMGRFHHPAYLTEKVAWTVTVISFFRVDVSCTP